MTDKKPSVTIYTDGGADPNPGPGGWAARLIAPSGTIKEISGAEPDTTNNRMELIAAIEALRALEQPSKVRLYTDSRYLQQGISAWLPAWVKRGWKLASKAPVKNEDLWRALHAETQRHAIEWHWVRGHAGNVHNERVDVLVHEARRALRREQRREQPALEAPAPATAPDIEIALRVASAPGGSAGGWAIRLSGADRVHTGRETNGSANRALLAAALAALRLAAPGASVRVYCPDAYLCDGMNKWTANWQRRGWRTVGGTPVKHRDLWEALLAESGKRRVEWVLEPPGLTLAAGLEELAAQAARAR